MDEPWRLPAEARCKVSARKDDLFSAARGAGVYCDRARAETEILTKMIKISSSKVAPSVPPPNRSYHKPPSSVGIHDGFSLYANPDPDSETTIALIKLPIVFSANSYSTPLTQPIGLAYLAAVLEKAQYRVQMVDCPGADPDRIQYTPSRRFKVQGLDMEEALNRINPQSDIIGVTIMFSQEWPFIREFMYRIRERFPRARIVAGGEHITALPEFSLRDCPAIDYAIMGEGANSPSWS